MIAPGEYPRRLTERVWLLGNPFFSIYLVQGDGSSALVESGITATAGLVLDQLKGLSVDLSRIDLVLATHAHADHLTGAPALKQNLPGLSVATGAMTKKFLDKEEVQAQFRADDASESARMIELGGKSVPLQDCGELKGVIDRVVEPGEIIDLGGVRLEALDAPGHAIGGLVFWEPEEKILFCSDSLGFILPPDRFCANFYVDLDDYLATCETLVRLDPAWICPGHCGAFSGPEKDYFIQGTRAEIDWVINRVRERMPFEEVPQDLIEEIFKRHYIRHCRMFTESMMRYCSELLIQRAAGSERLRS